MSTELQAAYYIAVVVEILLMTAIIIGIAWIISYVIVPFLIRRDEEDVNAEDRE